MCGNCKIIIQQLQLKYNGMFYVKQYLTFIFIYFNYYWTYWNADKD